MTQSVKHTAIPGYLSGTWQIDPVHSEVSFSVRHMMVSKVRGYFHDFAGTIVTGDTPTALMARDYHSLWLNSAALALANGDLEAAGGVVVRDERGEPTGVLREECAWRFRDTHVRPTEDEMIDASREGIRIAIARGVTAVHDKDGWLGALGVWQRLRDEGSLKLRVWQSMPAERVDELADLRVRSGFGDDLVRIGYLKAFMDGTLGSQTARMLDGSGVQITSREQLAEIIRRGAQAGLPVAVHAIGDLANREALDAFEETRGEWQPLGLRHRIEHAQLLGPEDLPRFAALGIAVLAANEGREAWTGDACCD